MSRLLIFPLMLLLIVTSSSAATVEEQLKKLDFEERADQVCVVLGVETIRHGGQLPNADRLMTSASGRAHVNGTTVIAKHAAVRANHHWYMLRFTCDVSDDHMKAYSFQYEIGSEIPQEQWIDFGLW